MKKIIAEGRYWVCENLDLLSPIIECGTEYLLSDNTRIQVVDGEPSPKFEKATEQEKHEFYNSLGFAFIGDNVDIFKGKLKGNNKKIQSFFTYIVPNTFGKKCIDYIGFEDGTKTAVQNCKIGNKRCLGKFKGITVGGRY